MGNGGVLSDRQQIRTPSTAEGPTSSQTIFRNLTLTGALSVLTEKPKEAFVNLYIFSYLRCYFSQRSTTRTGSAGWDWLGVPGGLESVYAFQGC